MAEKYITQKQREKCRKVADAFAELYELADVMVADAGRFGFVRLQWFSEGEGFDSAAVYSDSAELFEELWRIWYEHEVLTPVLGTPLSELDTMTRYSKHSQKKGRRRYRGKRIISLHCAGIVSNKTKQVTQRQGSYRP